MVQDNCPRAQDGKHRWRLFALGRICTHCELIQAKDEYEEGETSPPSRAAGTPREDRRES